MKILLDYFFPISVIEPTPQASTAFLKQVCIVVNPKSGVDPDEVTLCTSMAAVAALTDNTEAQQLFNAGMNRVYVLTANDLDLATILAAEGSQFFTLLISSDFDDADITLAYADGTVTITSYANLLTTTPDTVTVAGVAFTAQSTAVTEGTATFRAATDNDATAASLAAQINAHATTSALVTATVVGAIVTITANEVGVAGNDIAVAYADLGTATVGATLGGLSGGKLSGGAGLLVGTFKGVVGVSSADDEFLEDQAVIANRSAFHTTVTNKAKNMFYAFGKLLSNPVNWANQQYITMPFADDVDELGEAENLFDLKINFVISDDEYGQRLALFAAGGKAIVAPYIIRNLQIDMQSKGLSYISANQPGYTLTQAALLEDELQKVIDGTESTPGYVTKGWLTGGKVEVLLEQENFVASGYIEVPTPKAMWRIFGQLTQTT